MIKICNFVSARKLVAKHRKYIAKTVSIHQQLT